MGWVNLVHSGDFQLFYFIFVFLFYSAGRSVVGRNPTMGGRDGGAGPGAARADGTGGSSRSAARGRATHWAPLSLPSAAVFGCCLDFRAASLSCADWLAAAFGSAHGTSSQQRGRYLIPRAGHAARFRPCWGWQDRRLPYLRRSAACDEPVLAHAQARNWGCGRERRLGRFEGQGGGCWTRGEGTTSRWTLAWCPSFFLVFFGVFWLH